MATIVLSVEGVIANAPISDNLLLCESNRDGRVLYTMLRDSARILILSSDPSKDRVKAWLARERLTRYADVHCYPPDSMLSYAEWKIQHVNDLIGVGHHIAFYIDSDPEAVRNALEAGVGAILVAYPGVVPGRSTHEHSYSPWYDLVDSIEQQNLLRATKGTEVEQDG